MTGSVVNVWNKLPDTVGEQSMFKNVHICRKIFHLYFFHCVYTKLLNWMFDLQLQRIPLLFCLRNHEQIISHSRHQAATSLDLSVTHVAWLEQLRKKQCSQGNDDGSAVIPKLGLIEVLFCLPTFICDPWLCHYSNIHRSQFTKNCLQPEAEFYAYILFVM